MKPEALVEDLGECWSVANGYHKIFACCQYAHTVGGSDSPAFER